MRQSYYAGIDLGGTHIAVGIVSPNKTLISTATAPTKIACSASENIKVMKELLQQQLEERTIDYEQIKAIGLGVPGTANLETGEVEDINNLPQFLNVPIRKLLEEAFPKKRIFFENDANAAAWGEYTAGAGCGADSMIAVTIGTGIGGGIILNHQLYHGVNYAAGEFGHMAIWQDGIPCNCGRKGCFEAYASATALVQQTRGAMQEHPESRLWEVCNHEIDQMNGKHFFEALTLKDAIAEKVFEQYLKFLTAGIVNLVNLFQPEVLCIGGGVSEAGEILLKPLRESVGKEIYSAASKRQTQIRQAKLGNDAGIIGAALLGLEEPGGRLE